MIFPIIQAWMKQAGQFFCFRIQTREVWPFVKIAMMAGERQVFRRVLSAVLTWDDVFDVERQRFASLCKATIFASVFGAPPD